VAYIQRKYADLDDTFLGVVIMGRRSTVPSNGRFHKRYRELSGGGVNVLSYDRLLHSAEWWFERISEAGGGRPGCRKRG
jgi:hypothetical protein